MRHAAHTFSLKAGYTTTLMMRDNLRVVPEGKVANDTVRHGHQPSSRFVALEGI